MGGPLLVVRVGEGRGGAGREKGKWASYARLSGRKGEREKGKKGKGEGSWAEPKG